MKCENKRNNRNRLHFYPTKQSVATTSQIKIKKTNVTSQLKVEGNGNGVELSETYCLSFSTHENLPVYGKKTIYIFDSSLPSFTSYFQLS